MAKKKPDKGRVTNIDITWSSGEHERYVINDGTAVVILTTDMQGQGMGIISANEMALHMIVRRLMDFVMEKSEMAQNLLAAFALAMVPVPQTRPDILRASGSLPETPPAHSPDFRGRR